MKDYSKKLNDFYNGIMLNLAIDKVPDGVLDVDTNSVELAYLALSKFLTKENAESLRASIFFNNCHKVMILNKSKLGVALYKGAKYVQWLKLTEHMNEKVDNIKYIKIL